MNISELLHYSLKPQYWPELQRTIDNLEDNVDGEYERDVERSANLWYLAEQAIADYVQENGINLTDSEIESLCYRIENYLDLWLSVYWDIIPANRADDFIAKSVSDFKAA